MSSEVMDTLADRGKVYGPFRANAETSQKLKAVMVFSEGWGQLTPVMREAMELMAMKMSRILTGDPRHVDNWHDIAGYARLVEELLAPVKEPPQGTQTMSLGTAPEKPRYKTGEKVPYLDALGRTRYFVVTGNDKQLEDCE